MRRFPHQVRPGRVAGGLLAILGILAMQGPAVDDARAGEGGPPGAAHRSLRSNGTGDLPTATEPTAFAGYPGAPAFSVVPQKDQLTFYPCSACHAALPPNPTPRILYSPHPAAVPHGGGRFWCLDCHQAADRDQLHTLTAQPVDFDHAYLVCGQCHFRQQKDWYFGAHGKRVANWQGERQVYNCTHCHDPHDPVLKPRAPGPPPPIRAGLAPMPRAAAPAAGPYPASRRGGQEP